MKREVSSSRANVPLAIGGALLSVAGIGAASYSIFVWMLPGVDVGFADHLLVMGGTVSAVIGSMMLVAGLQRKKAKSAPS